MKQASSNGSSATSSVTQVTAEVRARVQSLPVLNISNLRNLRREFSKLLAKAEPEFVLNLAFHLMELPGFEFRFIGYELVQHHRAAFAGLNAPTLEKLGHGMDHWAAVDCFGCYLAGP